MLKLDVEFSKDFEKFGVDDELKKVLWLFTKDIDQKMWAQFRQEYGQKKKYYNAIRRLRIRPNEYRFLAHTGHIGLWRMVEKPEETTSQRGVKRSERLQVRLIRGKVRGFLPKNYFKAKKGVHARNDNWFLKKSDTFYDFLAIQADVITESALHE